MGHDYHSFACIVLPVDFLSRILEITCKSGNCRGHVFSALRHLVAVITSCFGIRDDCRHRMRYHAPFDYVKIRHIYNLPLFPG